MPPPEAFLQPLAALPDPLPVPVLAPTAGAAPTFSARLTLPGSKSLTNRALLLAALADGESTIRGHLAGADDTNRMAAALAALGAPITPGDPLRIRGLAGRWNPPNPAPHLDLVSAGTAVRFLCAAALLGPVPITIDGNPRMRERPLAELLQALESLGAHIDHFGVRGHPPVRIVPPAPNSLPSAPKVELSTTASGQFVSALLLVAPFLPGGLTILHEGAVTSRSYVQMTLGLLDHLGARVRTSEDLRVIRVAGGGLRSFNYTVEPDASSATYFWAAAAISPGSVCRVEGLDARSLQGDTHFVDVLARMGAAPIREEGPHPSIGLRGPAALDPVMADMGDMPDAALTLAVVCCFARGRSVIRGLRTLRLKESDRIAALQRELAKIGAKVETPVLGDPDAITITPPPPPRPAAPFEPVQFDTYDDHRMAMALALIGLKRPNTFIRNPSCVAKTFPGFWKTLAELY